MMPVALTLIVVGLTVVSLPSAAPCLEWSSVWNVGPMLIDRSIQSATRRNDYIYTPNIGAHKVHTQAVDWNSARNICIEESGHLAVINSRAESELIARLVSNSSTHLGSANTNVVHIGFHDLFSEGQFVTVNGESIETVGFNEWSDGEPNNGLGTQEDCGSMYRNGKLNDVYCNHNLGFVCELPYVPPSSPQPVSNISTDTIAYYTPNIGAYKVHTQAVDWNSARKICIEESGHLAVINSRAESELIARLIANSSSHLGSEDSQVVHIGFHDLFSEGQFVTVNGESIETVGFNEWSDGEPNNGPSRQEDCGSMYRNGKLNDVSCNALLAFVCEIPYVLPSSPQPVSNVITDTYF